MQIITGITSDPKQQISIPLPDGTSVSLGLSFRPQQKGWFYDIAYSTPTVNFQALGRRLVTSPNVLRQFQDVIPFGMALVASGGVEPTTQTGFTDGTLTLLLLDATDIADIESAIYTGSSRLATYGFTVGPTNPPSFTNGLLFFADCNWLTTVDTEDNKTAIGEIFNFLTDREGAGLTLYTYGAAFNTPYSESGISFSLTGTNPSPVLRSKLDELGYSYVDVDLSVPNAKDSVSGVFVLPLYSSSYEFTDTEIQNIQEISAEHIVIAFGEWNTWKEYDNRLMVIFGYPGITMGDDFPSGLWVPNSANLLGAAISINPIGNDATGSFENVSGFTESQIVCRVDSGSGPPGMIYLQSNS